MGSCTFGAKVLISLSKNKRPTPPPNPAHSSVKCNTVTNVGKKLRKEFYSLVFFEVYCLVDSESV